MTCRSCDTFSGDPCPVCRTCNRIKWLVQVGKLAVEQEAQAIQILRDCAGAIQDLVEAAGIHCRASESGERKSPVGRGETPEKEEPKKKKKHHRHRDKEKAEEESEKESEGKKPDQTEKTKRKAKSESQEDSSEAGAPLTTRGARGKRRKQRSSQKRRLKRKRCLPEVTLEEKAQGRDLRDQ